MSQTRRNFLKFFGGTAAGLMLSPLPWKLLDDASIWTQNWSWIARPMRGPVSWIGTTCTLCPAGCGLRVRLIAGAPVSAWAIPGHPMGNGCVCPTGLGAAQLPFHPARIRGAMRRVPGRRPGVTWRAVSTDEAVADVGQRLRRLRRAGAMDHVAILDLRPGRSLSTLYRDFLARAGGGRYLTLPGGRELAAATLADLIGDTATVPGYDFTRADAVVGFGAPLLDGWYGAAPAAGLLRDDGDGPFLVQVESHASVTASMADRWLAVRPGTEVALALGLAHVLIEEGRVDGGVQARIVDLDAEAGLVGYRDLVGEFNPRRVAGVTGCDPQVLRATARKLAACRQALVAGGGDPGGGPLGREEEAALWGLNLLLGSVGDAGSVTLRRDLAGIFDEPAPVSCGSLWDLPDGSLDLLIVDGASPGAAFPRDLLRRKLAGPDALMVALSPFVAGAAATADLVVPVAAAGEWTDDVPTWPLAPRTSYAVATATAVKPNGADHPADLLDRLAVAAGTEPASASGAARHARLLRRRAQILHDRGRGEVFDAVEGRSVPVSRILSADHLARSLAGGGCWTEEPDGTLGGREIRLLGPDRELASGFTDLAAGRPTTPAGQERRYPLVLMPWGRSGTAGGGALPPVVNKLHRESNLQSGVRRAHLNPLTADAHGLHDGRLAELTTPGGGMTVTVVCDEAVMPGVVRVAVGPDPLSLGDPQDDQPDVLSISDAARRTVWRVGPATLREV